MGDPKTPRRVWKKPKRPLNYDLMMDELNNSWHVWIKNKKRFLDYTYGVIKSKVAGSFFTRIKTRRTREKRTYTNTIAFKNWISRSKFNFR